MRDPSVTPIRHFRLPEEPLGGVVDVAHDAIGRDRRMPPAAVGVWLR